MLVTDTEVVWVDELSGTASGVSADVFSTRMGSLVGTRVCELKFHVSSTAAVNVDLTLGTGHGGDAESGAEVGEFF